MTGMGHTAAATALGVAMMLLAGLLRGFTGFGFSVAAVPLLSLIMPPTSAIPIVLLLQFCVSLFGLRPALRECDWPSIRLLGVGAAVATPLGAYGLAHLQAASVRLAIAAVVAAGGLLLARGFRMATAPTGAAVLPFGLICGLFNGLAGIPGPPIIAFYLASPITSAIARASMIVFFLATSVLALIPAAWFGLLARASFVGAAFCLPAVLLGSWLGAHAYRRSGERLYRRVALGSLLAMAALSAWRALLGALA